VAYGAAMTSSSGRFDALVLDFFGTLIPAVAPSVWLEHAARVATELGVASEDLLEALHESFPERATGVLGGVEAALGTLARRLGARPTDDQVRRAGAARREAHRELMTPRPGAVPVLRRIRQRGLRVGLLTDCTAELPDSWSQLPFAHLIDVPVFSCAVGLRKPDPRLFGILTDRLDVAPGRCLYVGDGAGEELSAASAAGMTAVRLAPADEVPDPRFPLELDWRGPSVVTLHEILPLLGITDA
jgi:putative hydrolase of the HAD superfamily